MNKGSKILLFLFASLALMAVSPDLSIAGDCLDSVSGVNARDASSLVPLDTLYVREFRFEGNTVFSAEELSQIVSDFLGREITPERLEEARRRLTEYYVEKGYVNSGALISDQKVQDGTVTFAIVEGKLAEIRVSGTKRLFSHYVVSRLLRATKNGKAPFSSEKMLARLKLLKEDPAIRNIHAKILPGYKPGRGILEADVEEAEPWHLWFTIDNHGSPSIGAWRGTAWFRHDNVTGWGDALQLKYGVSKGLNDYLCEYHIPLTRWDTLLSLRADRSASVIVAEPFDALDIKSKSTKFGGYLRQPLYRTDSRELAAELGLEKSKSEVSLKGEPFPFIPYEGDERGVYRVSALRFNQEFVDRGLTHVFAAVSMCNLGLDLFDSTIDIDEGVFGENAPNSRFFSWQGQAQVLLSLDRPVKNQLTFRINSQLSADPLLPSEQYSIGGYATVRGYRENLITTDNALTASIEWSLPLFRRLIHWEENESKALVISLSPFADWGTGWNVEEENPEVGSLSSLGLGLTGAIGKELYLRIDWAYALRDVADSLEYDIQDDGFHVSFRLNVF